MIRKSKITTLAELQTRKKQVRMETELAKREFAHTLGTTKENAGNFLLQKVVLPAGGAIAGLVVLVKLLSGSKKQRPVINETRVIHEYPKHVQKKARRSRLKKLTGLVGVIRVLVPVVQAVIGAFQTHKAKEAAQSAKRSARVS